ncbi:MAG: hypothetical protein AAGD38_20895 [Acidobacteriota bacterium]
MKRLLGIAFLLVALIVATVLHWQHHYTPRPRPAAFDPTSPLAELCTLEGFPLVMWMPFPHQNFGALDVEPAYLATIGRLAGLPAPRLLDFGPFALPPSNEMVIVTDEAGERFIVAARVYPVLAAFARLAGRLAANPYLAGGTVYVDEREAEVRWEGNVWSVRSGIEPSDESAASALEPTTPVYALIDLRQSVHPLPAARILLSPREGGGLTLGTENQVPDELWQRAAAMSSPDLALLLLEGSDPVLDTSPRGLAVFLPADDGAWELPSAASLTMPGAKPWELPGENLIRIGRDIDTVPHAGWTLRAFDGSSLVAARELTDALVPLTDQMVDDPLVWASWRELEPSLVEIRRIARMLEQVPLVPARDVERWRDAARVLAPLAADHERLMAVVAAEPRALRLELIPRATTE